MKLTTILMVTVLMQASAASFGQRLTLVQPDVTFEKVILEIRKQTGYDVLIENTGFNTAQRMDANFQDTPLEAVMDRLINDTNLSYTIQDKIVVVRAKEKSFIQNMVDRLQAIDVHGRVVNKNGMPLAGASVQVKGSTRSTVTNQDGYFSLPNVNEKERLVVSYIGYVSQEVLAKEQLGNITLVLSDSKLDEVQVIAYGTTTQRYNTGSVGSVKAETIAKQPVGNVLNALVARVPGLDINQQSGVPGSRVTVRIRGENSLTAGANEPLYLIDGVPFLGNAQDFVDNNYRQQAGGGASPFNSLNPADIASIDVLKDADATAIYGSRGANGVILITTKKGQAGKTKIDLNMATGWGKLARRMDVLDRRDYLDMRYEALRNDGVDLATATVNVYDLKDWDTTRNVDWQEVLLGGTANYTNMQMSISGGTAGTYFGISGGYWRETTIFPGDFADSKGSTRFNINHTSPDNRFKAQLSGTFLKETNNITTNNMVHEATTLAPVAPELYTADGRLNWDEGTRFGNPLAALHTTFDGKTSNLQAHGLLSYRLWKGLEIKATLGYSNLRYETTYLVPESAQRPLNFRSRIAEFGDHTTQTWNIEPQLTYNTDFAGNRLSVLLGTTFQRTLQDGELNYATGFISDDVMRNKSAATDISSNYSYSEYKYSSIFLRANYIMSDRYILNITGRRDGSSRFGPGKAFGNFGAVGAAWLFGEEKVIQSALPFLSFGKLRASYGVTGSDAIGNYGYLSLYKPTSNAYMYYGENGQGLYPTGLSNREYQWESNRKMDFALELGFFRDRVLLNANYFRNRSSNQLVGYPVSRVTGFGTVPYNLRATVQNTGWELELNTINITKPNFSWTTRFNATLPENKLIDYPGLASSSHANDYVIGQPLTIVKLVRTKGIDPETGTMVFFNRDGEEITDGNRLTTADRTVVVNIAKQFYGGLLNGFTYKQWQLDVFFQFSKNSGLIYNVNGVVTPGNISNVPQYVYDSRWTGPGSDGTLNKLTQSTTSAAYKARARNIDDAAYEDIFFARLKNVALSYQLDPTWIRRLHLQGARIYAQGQNLATFTNYLGMDPESQLQEGASASIGPIATFMLGVQLTF